MFGVRNSNQTREWTPKTASYTSPCASIMSNNDHNDDFVWWKHGVWYQIYPRSFKDASSDGIGDLKGIISKLDYIQGLGFHGVWISPFFLSPMKDFGYDVSDYCNIDPIFGNLDDFKNLISEAHVRSLKIAVDFVPNHCSDQHPWFQESKKSIHSKKRDWFIWKDPKFDQQGNMHPPTNWISIFGGSAWEYDTNTNQYYMHSFLKEQPDLNWRNAEVQKAMMDVLIFWMDLGVDGFRMDAIRRLYKDVQFRDNPRNPKIDSSDIEMAKSLGAYESQLHIYDMFQPEIHETFRKFRKLAEEYEKKQSRRLVIIGEAWGPPQDTTTFYGDPDQKSPEFHLVFNFTMMQLPWKAQVFRKHYEDFGNLVPRDCHGAIVLGSHDEHRLTQRFPQGFRIAALMLLTLRGTPFIYYGDEIGMLDGKIPEDCLQDPWPLRTGMLYLSRDPGRTPMQWTADSESSCGFTSPGVKPWLPIPTDPNERTSINVEHQQKEPSSLLYLYKKMIQLRNSHKALNKGTFRSLNSDEMKIKNGNYEDVWIYERKYDSEIFVTLLNFSTTALEISLPNFAGRQGWKILSTLSTSESQVDATSIHLEGNEGILVKFP